MTREHLVELLEGRAPGAWELYEKSALSHEAVTAGALSSALERSEQGWAARWWESGIPRFAAASSPARLSRAVSQAALLPAAAAPAPDWPAATCPAAASAPVPQPPPPNAFEELARLVAAESRGEAILTELALRRGRVAERIVNAKGGDVSFGAERLDGVALCVGRRGARACEARVVFCADGALDMAGIARRLADRATLPLSDQATPFARGEWLLDPSVSAALLSGLAPLFVSAEPPPWVSRSHLASECVTLVDDATADAPFDGEGVATRRAVLVQQGRWRSRLHDLTSAKRQGGKPTGHGVRPSYRTPPAAGPRRLFFETSTGVAPLELLAAVKRGLFAAAPTAPVKVDLAADRFVVEFTGVAVVAGRAQGGVAGARAAGRISELLRRIAAVSTDRCFFPHPYLVGAPTLLVERAAFD
ncbi:MAG: metallopeptidase TldD-related protein [Thermoanaerobaculia bacterium]